MVADVPIAYGVVHIDAEILDVAPSEPPGRKCETPGCDAPPCPTDWDPQGIEQSDGYLRSWAWECTCGWKRIEPVSAGSSFVVAKAEADTQ